MPAGFILNQQARLYLTAQKAACLESSYSIVVPKKADWNKKHFNFS
jgi:hypothetical protein